MTPLCNLTSLTVLHLQNTDIFGTLLTVLHLQNTDIFGTLEPLKNLGQLQAIYLDSTFLSGDLTALSLLTNLNYLHLQATNICGDLNPLAYLIQLKIIYLHDTYVSGDLWPLYDLINLSYVTLSNALISGNLLPLFGLSALNYIALNNNTLTGDLSVLSSINTLNYALLNDNSFTGQIPSLINTSLTYFNVESNKLSDVLGDDIFPDTLVVLDIAKNAISGNLPNSILALPKLQVFDASINCMTLEFSNDVCHSKSIEYLILDGLHGSSSCRSVVIDIIDTIYEQVEVVTNVPDCIYSLSQLKYLHLSGNGIKGSLPTNVTISSNFTELAMSNNELTSIIPSVFQSNVWSYLDLSYNRLTGDLSPNLNVNNTIHLKVNRLSGLIPKSLYETTSVSILTGNMFQCTPEQLYQLNDEIGSKYICGSNSFNSACYSCAALLFFILILLACAYLTRSYTSGNQEFYYCKVFTAITKRIDHVVHMTDTNSIITSLSDHKIEHEFVDSIQKFAILMHDMKKFSFLLTIVLVCVYIPLYATFSVYYSTYTFKYAWVTSGDFLSGVNVGLVLYVLYVVLIVVVSYFTKMYESRQHKPNSELLPRRTFSWVVIILFLFSINLGAMLSLNGLYVYVLLNKGAVEIAAMGIFLSIFKVIWTNLVMPELLAISALSSSNNYSSTRKLNFLTIISILNNIVIPCLATTLVDPQCLYNMIFYPDEVTSEFSKITHDTYSDGTYTSSIYIKTTSSSQYVPPFSYSYMFIYYCLIICTNLHLFCCYVMYCPNYFRLFKEQTT